jgi:acetolactate synthase I/III small subunit
MMRHIINLEVENHVGVLARIANQFSARGFNIDSISIGKADPDETAHITLVVQGDEMVIEQVKKQLNKLIDIIRVVDVTKAKNNFVGRELVLVKVNCPPSKRIDITQLVNIFGAKVVDISKTSMTMELCGSESKVSAFLEQVNSFGIKDIARTGTIAMLRDFNG